MNPHGRTAGFEDLGIAPKILEILFRYKFTAPTPIQLKSIPPALEGKDIMGIAQTGTGKTLAFGIPMIQRIALGNGAAIGLVILPTRELAVQVHETIKKIGGPLGLRAAVLIGGEDMRRQVRAIEQRPHVIIGTPGRLNDHLDGKRLSLDRASIVVLDEADRMLDMGFAPQIQRILKNVPQKRQTLLFSATMPHEVVKIAQSYMSLPLRIEVAPAGSTIEGIDQEVFFVKNTEKLLLLSTLLSEYKGSVLVFCRTKHSVKKITRVIRSSGERAAEIHSNRTLNQRLEALEGFKIGKYRILLATDIAARGIDVKGIQLVVNYDLPEQPEDYVHRIGRTGRAGHPGHAISFATFDQKRDVKQIERLIKKVIRASQTPSLSAGFISDRNQDSRQPRTPYGRGNPHKKRSRKKPFRRHRF
ncbi:DEAD/DEAH box helicase [Candidatus Uhrbacteria bacterium]|nr:DEAD/DEAH box helicase [Candidatus Uhrbacteria bacterium]